MVHGSSGVGLSVSEGNGLVGFAALRTTQTFQNPLTKEYTLNYNRISNMS